MSMKNVLAGFKVCGVHPFKWVAFDVTEEECTLYRYYLQNLSSQFFFQHLVSFSYYVENSLPEYGVVAMHSDLS